MQKNLNAAGKSAAKDVRVFLNAVWQGLIKGWRWFKKTFF